MKITSLGNKGIESVLRYSCFLFLFSRGLLYVIFDSPYRALLWSEATLAPYLEGMGIEWSYYADVSNPWICALENGIGIFLILASFCFLSIKPDEERRWKRWLICAAGTFTMLHVLLVYLGHNREFPVLPEYLLQGLCPWLFLGYLRYFSRDRDEPWSKVSPELLLWTKIALSCCFIGHGLYAFGWPYQPAYFVDMLVRCTQLDFAAASFVTRVIGAVDIFLGVALFVRGWERVILGHMFVWGMLTALSRVLSYVIVPMMWSNWNPWVLETTVRVVHGGLPLFLMCLYPTVQGVGSEWRALWMRLKKPSFLVGVSAAVMMLTLFSQNHGQLKDEAQQGYTKRIELLQQQKIQHTYTEMKISQKSGRGLSFDDFKQSTVGQEYWYSDSLFSHPIVPVRFVVEQSVDRADQREGLMDECQEYYQNKEVILTTLEGQIVADYRSKNPTAHTKDEKVLRFIKKVRMTLDGAEMLQINVDVPWGESRTLVFNVDSYGALVENP